MEPLTAADQLDDLLRHARIVPLTTEVRVERAALAEAVGRLRRASGAPADAVARIERCAAAAKPVPLTDQVRVDRPRIQREIDAIRLAVRSARAGTSSSPTWAAVETLEELVRGGKGGWPAGRVKVDRRAFTAALGTLRTNAAVHGPHLGSLAGLEELVRDADGDAVRISPAAFDRAMSDVRRQLAAG